MKLVNETTNEYLEKLKEEAIERYQIGKGVKINDFSFIVRLTTIGALFLILMCVFFFENKLLFWSCAIVAFILAVFATYFIVEMIRVCRDCKRTLTDEERKAIQSSDYDVECFNENLNKYMDLTKAEILNYLTMSENIVHIEYADNQGFVEKMVILAKLKKKKDMAEPMLVLKNDGFVFYEPYVAKC